MCIVTSQCYYHDDVMFLAFFLHSASKGKTCIDVAMNPDFAYFGPRMTRKFVPLVAIHLLVDYNESNIATHNFKQVYVNTMIIAVSESTKIVHKLASSY